MSNKIQGDRNTFRACIIGKVIILVKLFIYVS
jgi:hypothetical protein